MGTNWILIAIVICLAIALIVFLIWRNQKDKEELTRKLIEQEEASLPKEDDTEVDSIE